MFYGKCSVVDVYLSICLNIIDLLIFILSVHTVGLAKPLS